MSSYLAQSLAQTLLEPKIHGLLTYIGILISIFWLLAKASMQCSSLLNVATMTQVLGVSP
jgi:hypothetical protein